MTLVLHYAPENASLIVRLVLEEMALPYGTTLVDRAARAQQGAAYRALNPAGLIPVLETPQGPIFETAAILLWLTDRQGSLAPPARDARRGDYLKWLVFTSNTLHAMLRMTFYPEKYVGPDPAAQAALRSRLQGGDPTDMTLPRALALLETRLGQGDGWAWGDGPAALDYYIACLLRWCALYPVGATGWYDIRHYPALATMARRLEQRPASRAAIAAEGLGPTPFSSPRHATPPEGSAT